MSFPTAVSPSLRRAGGLLSLTALLAASDCTPVRESIDTDSGNSMMDPSDEEKKPGTITISPGNASITINGSAQMVNFRALSSKLGDVTNLATWTVSDSSVGSIVKGKLTIQPTLQKGGSYKVFASLRGSTASAPLLIKLIAPDEVDSTAPPDAKDYFSGSSGGPAPSIAYPFDKTMMAANVLQLAMQWQAAAG